jgi:NADP-dependent 3-hydroxy acid dehydrogenase YdfG
MSQPPLREQVAIITGASSGIGAATALALGRAGLGAVALAARREEALQAVARAVEAAGTRALPVVTDVGDRTQVEQLVRHSLTAFGHVDILVASAGAYIRGRVADLARDGKLDAFEQAMAVNYYGGLYPTLALLPHMLAQGRGHLIFVNSFNAKKGVPPDAPYVAAKSALAGFGGVLRQELHGTGVYVTSLFPGRIDTAMVADIQVPRISAKLPPDAVAQAIVRALRTRAAEVIVPPQAWLLMVLNDLSPRLGDWLTRNLRLEGWKRTPSG